LNVGAQLRAKQFYDLERYEDALAEYTNASLEDPDDAGIVAMMALCEMNLGHKKRSIDTAKRAVSMAPDDETPHYALALAYANADNVKLAHKAIDEAIRIAPEDADYLAIKSAICAQGGDWKSAAKWARLALDMDPESAAAQQVYSQALAITGDIGEASEVGAKALYDNPDDADAHCANGFIYLRQGKHREAATHFREALRLEPSNESGAEGMAIALKSVFPPYRWLVRAQLWMAGQGKAVQIAIIVAVIAIPRVLRAFARESETLRPYLFALAVPFTLLIWFTWFGDSLLNVLLRFHPFGKFLLKRHESIESNFIVCLIVFGVIGLLLTVVSSEHGVAIAFVCLTGLLIVGLSTNIESNLKLRGALVWTFGGLCTGIAALGSIALLVSPPRATP
jgi:tetratricopeptide (TPR) repeat protein